MSNVEHATNQIDILDKLAKALDKAIMATPTSAYRNQLADMAITTTERRKHLAQYIVNTANSGQGKSGKVGAI